MKDYWKMTDGELEGLAEKFKLPSHHEGTVVYTFDRDRVINGLVFRDNARRSAWALGISVLALLVSIVSIALQFIFNI